MVGSSGVIFFILFNSGFYCFWRMGGFVVCSLMAGGLRLGVAVGGSGSRSSFV